MAMDRIQSIAESTESELERYLEHLGWASNPFARQASMDEYVLPSENSVADIANHIRDYTGPVLIHSQYSGVGKTTLLQMLLESYADEFTTVGIGEHNVTAYELIAIVADELDVGKSSSTKLTERKVANALEERDQEVLLGVDEFGLNNSDTLHVIQFLNDLDSVRVIMTGMTSQWDAIGGLGSDGRAFQRRVSYELELEPLTRDQAEELYKRRVATAADVDHGEWASLPMEPLTEGALDVVYERSDGVPAVIIAAVCDLIGLGAYRYAEVDDATITDEIAKKIEYADPHADSDQASE
ncbi:AAA family ATPase [Halorubrum tropicale]|nr:AAA family ATPase [Halorubrum tropicale]